LPKQGQVQATKSIEDATVELAAVSTASDEWQVHCDERMEAVGALIAILDRQRLRADARVGRDATDQTRIRTQLEEFGRKRGTLQTQCMATFSQCTGLKEEHKVQNDSLATSQSLTKAVSAYLRGAKDGASRLSRGELFRAMASMHRQKQRFRQSLANHSEDCIAGVVVLDEEDRLMNASSSTLQARSVALESDARANAAFLEQVVNASRLLQGARKEFSDRCSKAREELLLRKTALGTRRSELLRSSGRQDFGDCAVSPWRAAGACSVTCGGGTRTMVREQLAPPAGGFACPKLSMEMRCNEDPCPTSCRLSDWSDWSSCSTRCSGGRRFRKRTVEEEAVGNGAPCGPMTELQDCSGEQCGGCVFPS